MVVFVIFYCKAAIMVFFCYCCYSDMDGGDLVGMKIPKCQKNISMISFPVSFFAKKYVWILYARLLCASRRRGPFFRKWHTRGDTFQLKPCHGGLFQFMKKVIMRGASSRTQKRIQK